MGRNQDDDILLSSELPAIAENVGAVAAASREMAEIQAAVIMAIRYPRNEADCYAKILEACKRPSFAEGARYVFPRGGATVEGPSVKFAREAARCWKNIRYGYRVVDRNEDYTTLEGWALDLETNTHVSTSAIVRNLIYRKSKGWIIPDERDLRELLGRNGAIAVRNAILQVLPHDVTEEAIVAVRETMRKAAAGEIKQDKAQTIRRLVVAFRDLGIIGEMVEAKLGHGMDLITPDELADLRSIYTSIRDGQSGRDDHFEVPKSPGAAAKLEAEQGGSALDGLAKAMNKGKTPEAAPPAAAPDTPRETVPAPSKTIETPVQGSLSDL